MFSSPDAPWSGFYLPTFNHKIKPNVGKHSIDSALYGHHRWAPQNVCSPENYDHNGTSKKEGNSFFQLRCAQQYETETADWVFSVTEQHDVSYFHHRDVSGKKTVSTKIHDEIGSPYQNSRNSCWEDLSPPKSLKHPPFLLADIGSGSGKLGLSKVAKNGSVEGISLGISLGICNQKNKQIELVRIVSNYNTYIAYFHKYLYIYIYAYI